MPTHWPSAVCRCRPLQARCNATSAATFERSPLVQLGVAAVSRGIPHQRRDLLAHRTFSSFEEPLDALMLSFCSSCTMRPQNRLNVRGNRTCGLTSISTFLAVCTYTACTDTMR